jgi:hypothetical protein
MMLLGLPLCFGRLTFEDTDMPDPDGTGTAASTNTATGTTNTANTGTNTSTSNAIVPVPRRDGDSIMGDETQHRKRRSSVFRRQKRSRVNSGGSSSAFFSLSSPAPLSNPYLEPPLGPLPGDLSDHSFDSTSV